MKKAAVVSMIVLAAVAVAGIIPGSSSSRNYSGENQQNRSISRREYRRRGSRRK